MTDSAALWIVNHSRIRRIHRIGVCPVLEVEITYPRLDTDRSETGEVSPAVTRFNEAYRVMAENLLAFAEGGILTAAEADFTAAGETAAYRFDRRTVICDMIAVSDDSAPNGLVVTRTLRVGSRRGTIAEQRISAEDRWRLPELTAVPKKERNRRKKSG